MIEPTNQKVDSRGEARNAYLQGCLVEGDRIALTRARRLRRKALLISLALQAGLLTALILQPLVATGERPVRLRMTPVPPWQGSPHATTRSNAGSSGPRRSAVNRLEMVYQSLQISHNVPVPGGGLERGDTRGTERDFGPDVPEGPLPPLGTKGTGLTPLIPAPVRPPGDDRKRIVRSTDIQEALLHRVTPVYPPVAIHARIERRVQLHAIIGRNGAVNSLEVTSGHPLLAHAALEAVRQWRYRPTLLGGEPVEVETYITVVFRFQR